MIANIIKKGIFKVKVTRSYQHRISVTGNPLDEVALIGLKMGDIHREMIG